MALPVIERPGSSNPCNLHPLVGESYELKLKQSIRSLLAEIRKQDHEPEFEPSRFIQEEKELYELMQARVDPPLDSIWVYTALIFRGREYPKNEPLDFLDSIAAAKRLFHLASAFSASCGSSKSIALLAPVVYEVYKVVLQLSGKDLTLKREKKVMKEVKSLTEAILAHINVCCGTGKDLSDVAEAGLKSITPFVDLVGVWMDSNVGLESFLPLVTAEVRERLSEGECEVGYLAGVVITEAFLLKLCLNFKLGVSGTREDLEKETRSWAVGSITDFCNFYFFETLLRMLLEKNLPLAFILSSEDGDLLRKVLYDAIILVDYSFLELEAAIHLPADHMRSLYMTRLIVTHEAIEYVREHGDQRRSISYSNAFSNSHLQTQIIKWFKNQILTEENASKFNGSSPKALIKWLLNLEDQGVRVFEDSSLKYHSKLVRDTSKPDFEQPACKLDSKRVEDDLLFYVDNKGEKEDTDEEDEDTNESMNAAFIAASHAMKSMDKGGRKRKEGTSAEKKKKTKYIKYELLNNYESSSGSEVENPPSDEDSESKDE